MKVRCLVSIAGVKFAYAVGDIVEMDDAEAERYIRSGAVEAVTSSPKAKRESRAKKEEATE